MVLPWRWGGRVGRRRDFILKREKFFYFSLFNFLAKLNKVAIVVGSKNEVQLKVLLEIKGYIFKI